MLVSSSSLREAPLDVAVAVAPGAELLDDPRRQPGRRVVERRSRASAAWCPGCAGSRSPPAGTSCIGIMSMTSSCVRPSSGLAGSGGNATTMLRWMPATDVGVVGAEVRASPSRPSRRPARRSARSRGRASARPRAPRSARRPCPARARDRRSRSRASTARRRRRRRPDRRRARRVGERADDLRELGDRSRPAVRDDERERLRPDAARVDEVDARGRRRVR